MQEHHEDERNKQVEVKVAEFKPIGLTPEKIKNNISSTDGTPLGNNNGQVVCYEQEQRLERGAVPVGERDSGVCHLLLSWDNRI